MRKLVPFVLLFLLAWSCKEPRSVEQSVKGEGPFVFSVDMSDSTALYDFDFYARVDAPEIPAEVQLLLRWTSPSDSVYRETVYLPLSDAVYSPYRTGVSPYEPGVWTLTASLLPLPEGFRGLGLVVRKQSQ